MATFDIAFSQDPYPAYCAFRANGPLQWSEEFPGGAWLFTDYADVMNALRDPRFSVQRVGRWINSSGPNARHELRDFKRILARAMLFMDGAQHTRLRKVMNPAFRPGLLQLLRPNIQSIVDDLLDKMVLSGVVDFMADFARPLPALVIAEMLNIDSCDRADFVSWSDDIADFIGSPTPSMGLGRKAQQSAIAMDAYFRDLLPSRRRNLGDDLISLLLRAESDGNVITSQELLAQCSMLLFAGHETTRNLLGNGLFALLKYPDQWRLLRSQPTLMQTALRELLRYDSPVQYTGRRLKEDVEVHGKKLKKGQLVILLIGSANRDPARFHHPDLLDIRRDQGNHLSFGFGPHVCIGAALTYLEADIAFRGLMERVLQIQLLEEPCWSGNTVYRGLSRLPLQIVWKEFDDDGAVTEKNIHIKKSIIHRENI